MARWHRRHWPILAACLCCAWALGAGSLHADGENGVLTVLKGDCTLVRGGEQTELKPDAKGILLKTGDVVRTANNAQVEVTLGCGSRVAAGENTSLSVKELSRGADGCSVCLELHEGTAKATVNKLDEQQGEKKRCCTLSFLVGQSTIRGDEYEMTVQWEREGEYSLDVTKGRVILRYENGPMIILAAAVTITEGAPIKVKAQQKNAARVIVSCVGSVIVLLRPDQPVAIEREGEGIRVTNFSNLALLYAGGWKRVPLVSIDPGKSRLFKIEEPEVSYDRAIAHSEVIAALIEEAFPDAFPPSVEAGGEGGTDVFGRPGITTEHERNIVSPAE